MNFFQSPPHSNRDTRLDDGGKINVRLVLLLGIALIVLVGQGVNQLSEAVLRGPCWLAESSRIGQEPVGSAVPRQWPPA